ncbi:MAG: ribonuclease III [Bacillota bacterium]
MDSENRGAPDLSGLGAGDDRLRLAFTHASYAHEHADVDHNERLEFLGDAVLALVVSEWLYQRFPHQSEGELTARRAALVCESSLAGVARELGLGHHLRLGRGEAAGGGRERPSILAAALEAVVGAVFLDAGLDRCRELVQAWFAGPLEAGAGPDNPKARLQEVVQETPGLELEYRVVEETGPAHDPTFYVAAYIGGQLTGSGAGKSKKAAEKNAARASLEKLQGSRAERADHGHHSPEDGGVPGPW